ncbi:protein amnionless [Megachile rotundata]|uniref:protein amnionless n=1 Tax=Megachile rotundata TaxID=143995 RepID=UPI003FD1398E
MKMWYEILLLLLLTKACVGIEKYWLPNLEWETARNWVENRTPEIDSRVIFPLEMRHAAGLSISKDLRFSGFDLARTGSLVLPRDGNIQLKEEEKSKVKISQWARTGHIFWADPQNWNGSSEAAPHLERVPCRQDDIVLPEKKKTFSILLPMRNIEVRSVRMSDEKHPLSSWQWTEMEDRREFHKRFTVSYAEYSCDKCACQNDQNGDYLEEICAIERPKCGFTPCEFPLTVEGHCCRYCGGRVSLTNKASLPVVRVAADEAFEGYTESLAWHVRRTSNGAVEVLIKEKNDYTEINILEAVENMKKALISMNIEVSSTETAGAALQDNRLAVALVPLFGTPFIIFVILFFVFLYFGYSYRHMLSGCTDVFSSIRDGTRVDKSQSKPFSFARFENIPEGNVQIANVAVAEEQPDKNEETEEEDSGGRFENPLYRSKRKKKEEIEVLNMDAPLRLTALKDKVEGIEEADVDIH